MNVNVVMNERDVEDLEHAAHVIRALRAKVAAYDAAAEKFLAKVERGDARSTVTYRELKAAHDMQVKRA